MDQLPGLLLDALTKVNSICRIQGSVFLGRSLGSMVAAMQSSQWRPRGLVLEGTSPKLSDAIYTYMESLWSLRPTTVLPVSMILKEDYSLKMVLDNLVSTKVIIFQGSADSRTPLLPVKQLIAGRSDTELIEVKGATHANAYMKAMPDYIDKIEGLLNSK